MNKLVPELDVSDLEVSLAFYVDTLGFTLLYQRPEEKFAYLDLNGAEIMLQEAAGPGRRFRTARLKKPYGRGINLQIEVDNVRELHGAVIVAGHEFVVPLETRWYRIDEGEAGNQQFVVADPDGYLLRFFQPVER